MDRVVKHCGWDGRVESVAIAVLRSCKVRCLCYGLNHLQTEPRVAMSEYWLQDVLCHMLKCLEHTVWCNSVVEVIMEHWRMVARWAQDKLTPG